MLKLLIYLTQPKPIYVVNVTVRFNARASKILGLGKRLELGRSSELCLRLSIRLGSMFNPNGPFLVKQVFPSKCGLTYILLSWLLLSWEIFNKYLSCDNLQRLNGLGVWFSLWVREVPGSNPGWALSFWNFLIFIALMLQEKNSQHAVTRIRTWVTAATTQGPNH